MRSYTAIICLSAFFALQYGKLISYWQCKFASVYTSTRCDCVQQLLDTSKNAADYPTPTLKEKTPEIVLFQEVFSEEIPAPVLPVRPVTAHLNIIPETRLLPVFQPPRLA